jgi:dihydrodipicolinate synthase/N-acetylneuraminate lyase
MKELLEEEDLNLVIERLSKMGVSPIYPFGNLGESQSGRDIIELISIGKKPENLSLAMKLTFARR